ncbi:MAG: hypothetical protein OM95_05415 [Bdellovibrio sp. ArHS]|uniref:hypothetical protein n=1 Tax=Bdellovibrio sp. ArHS TaxID=1569284 RepID=UPI000582A08A|nr:hypothetical protein [Bdellovibrio sp. ArHS]KHD89249.1 MAG: hypothetical protein OM95_05415 [Bdellovibrio sp. ArHS]
MKLTLRHLILFLLFLLCQPGFAQESTSVMPIPEDVKNWNLKVELEAKSTFDSEKKINGSASEADIQGAWRINELYGLVLGFQISHKDEAEARETSLDQVKAGLRISKKLWDLKWRIQMTYNYLLQEAQRIDDARDGALLLDIRTHLPLQTWGKARLRLKHSEYLPREGGDDIELRQSKLEFSPSYLWGRWAAGLKNHITRSANFNESVNTLDIAPFVKFAGDHFEPLFKVIYRPVEKSSHFATAENWESHPVYALEMEMNF